MNSIFKVDTERCNLKLIVLKALKEEIATLKQPLGSDFHEGQITQMNFEHYQGSDQQEVKRLVDACVDARLKAISAISEVDMKKEEYDAFHRTQVQGTNKAKEDVVKAESTYKEEDEKFKEAKGAFTSHLDSAIDRLESRTKAFLDLNKAKKTLCEVELPLLRKGSELKGLEDAALEAKKILLQNIGDLHLVGKAQAPPPPVPLDDEPLPDSVTALQNMVRALKASVAREEAARLKVEGKVQKLKLKLKNLPKSSTNVSQDTSQDTQNHGSESD